MNGIIQLKCPFCGAPARIQKDPLMEKKSYACVNCRRRYPFAQWKKVSTISVSGQPTTIQSNDSHSPVTDNDDGCTRYSVFNLTIGMLMLVGTNISYQLKLGANVIGRKSKNSTVDFAIETGEERSMSRKHLLIEVVKEPVKGYVHYASLCKNNVNPTTVNGRELSYGIDRVVLNDGAIIKLPDAELRFEIPDEDATRIQVG